MSPQSRPRMPVFFIPHGGGPCFFMDWNPPDEWDRHRAFLEGLSGLFPARPKALLVVSAHWEAPQFTVQAHPAPPLLFDYYGFPEHTYQLTWPAPGDPVLADKVKALIEQAGFAAATDLQRGFDHGVFVPLKVAFPAADIPTIQLSLRDDLDAGAHVAVGEALAPLRHEGVAIIGSGNTYHNLAAMRRAMGGAGGEETHGEDFDRWLADTVGDSDAERRNARLTGWADAPGARDSHPREDHLIPLLVAAGAAGSDVGERIFADRVMGGIESAFRFG